MTQATATLAPKATVNHGALFVYECDIQAALRRIATKVDAYADAAKAIDQAQAEYHQLIDDIRTGLNDEAWASLERSLPAIHRTVFADDIEPF